MSKSRIPKHETLVCMLIQLPRLLWHPGIIGKALQIHSPVTTVLSVIDLQGLCITVKKLLAEREKNKFFWPSTLYLNVLVFRYFKFPCIHKSIFTIWMHLKHRLYTKHELYHLKLLHAFINVTNAFMSLPVWMKPSLGVPFKWH